MTNILFEHMTNEYNKEVVFPVEYFYPFPGNQRKNIDMDYRFKFVNENTHAIHHWGTSWTQNKKYIL